jgi:hypothetical protein
VSEGHRITEADAPDGILFRVWDKERGCWAGSKYQSPNTRDLEDYALNEFKDDHLVYCDMEGWALEDDGGLLLVDECGNFAYAPTDRYEVRLDTDFIARCGHESAKRWRDRALAAESDPLQIRNMGIELARAVMDSKQNVGREMRHLAQVLINAANKSEPMVPSSGAAKKETPR